MIAIRCHECKRRYNWAGDPFCPHCGAFNQAKDYSFDRERVEVSLEEDGPETVLFRRKKTATGHANNAPDHTFSGRKPGEAPGARTRTSQGTATTRPAQASQPQANQAQAAGCLRKIVIAIVLFQVAMVGLTVLSQMLFGLL